MPTCPYCQITLKSIRHHIGFCKVYAHAKQAKEKRKSAGDVPKHRGNVIRQRLDTQATEASLFADSHNAPRSIVSDHLTLIPSVRNRAKKSCHTEFHDHGDSNGCDINFDDPDGHNEPTPQYCEPVSGISTEDKERNRNAQDQDFINQFMKFIDPDAPDPFDPDNCDEDELEFITPTFKHVGKLPDNILAQIDLMRILSRSGCSLSLYDKIIRWVLHYSNKIHGGGIWTQFPIEYRKTFIRHLSRTFDTEKHYPSRNEITFSFDKRRVNIPTFSFRTEALSLLHDPTVMSKDNIIENYDIFSGKCGENFWEPNSIHSPDAIPQPVDPLRPIGDINTSCLFQKSVARFCTKPHHMPVPIIIFYDKANLDRKGGLAVAPLIFTFGFFRSSIRRKSLLWRILAYVPNLDIGKGKSNAKDANEKQREHHRVLALALSELQSICQRGGLKTKIRNKIVVLKFFIQFVIGDTAGHNDLCLQFQINAEQPCRDCHCSRESLSSFDSSKCLYKSLNSIIRTSGNQEQLRKISQRYRVVNAFYNLPMSDRTRGIFGCTPWETLHVFDQGILMYIMESFHDIVGEKTAGKSEKQKFNDFFEVISWYLSRQSERDFPRRSLRFSWIEGTRITATERLGNLVVFLISLHVKDVKLFVSGIFDKYNSKISGSPGPSVQGCADALAGILCYEKWLKDQNPAGEILASETRIREVLTKLTRRFPRREGTDGWNLQKLHGAFKMGTQQMHRHGNADCWNSSHGERMHQFFSQNLVDRPSVGTHRSPNNSDIAGQKHSLSNELSMKWNHT